MSRKHGKRFVLLLLALFAVFIGVTGRHAYQVWLRARRDQALIRAIRQNDLRGVERLLAQGASPDAKGTLYPPRNDFLSLLKSLFVRSKDQGRTALEIAVSLNRLDIAALLVRAGATNLNARHAYGRTLLMNAARGRNVKLTEALLEKKVDVNAQDWIKSTALMYALGQRQTDIARLLLDHGADVNRRDEIGRTALWIAAGSRPPQKEIMRLLLDRGANANTQESIGLTPLMFAASWGTEETVQMLLDHGADIHAKGMWGTAQQIAARKGRTGILKRLQQAGAAQERAPGTDGHRSKDKE
jgi:ankyrin repeat protein